MDTDCTNFTDAIKLEPQASLVIMNQIIYSFSAQSEKMREKVITAFTLVELLVVISIIAMLLGILMPIINLARAKAKSVVCKSNLHSCAVAMTMYLDDNERFMPPAAQMPSLGTGKPGIRDFILGYLSGEKSLNCPGDPKKKFFLSEGSSYEYNAMLGGQRVEKTFFADRFGEKEVHVLRDYEWFHGKRGSDRSYNYLYADGYVSYRER